VWLFDRLAEIGSDGVVVRINPTIKNFNWNSGLEHQLSFKTS
jgi:hypothetical protein